MAPNHQAIQSEPEPVSRTYQYRKVMKPMLERKRRARINRCLDELKEIMMVALQTEGEHVAKLEKADILELTVRHLQKLKHSNKLNVRPEQTYIDRFRAGFKHCANEVTHFLDGADHCTTIHLIKHLNSCIRRLDGMQPLKEVVPMHARPKYFAGNCGTQQQQQQYPMQQPYNMQIHTQQQQELPVVGQHHIHASQTPPSPSLIDSQDPNLVWRPW